MEPSKMQVLLYIITIFFSIEKYYLKINKIKFLSLSALVFFIMILSFSYANKERGTYNSEDGLTYYSSHGLDWDFSSVYFLPYMYVVTPWTNLQYVTESQNSRTYGLWSFKPFLGYLQLDDYFTKSFKLTPYSSFNTFTFIAVGFKDFGFWFSIIPTMFIGFMVRKSYFLYLNSNYAFDVATFSVLSLAVLEMFFSNHFFMVSYPFTMIILRLISIKINQFQNYPRL